MALYLSQLGKLHAASSVICTGVAEELLSSLALSYSHYSTSTSCLVDPPILPAWPISVLLKYMIDRIQIILPHQMKMLDAEFDGQCSLCSSFTQWRKNRLTQADL